MIEIKEVVKTFTTNKNQINAVKGVNLTIKDGEIFGIIGYSGAGKSTLIRMLNGLEKPTSGQIIVDGINLSELSHHQLLAKRQKIGMIFQHFNLLWSKTVAQNIELALEFAKVDKTVRKAKVNELIRRVGLQGRENAYPSELSGGQKQRVGIARALANDPTILLCDEATSALDPDTTDAILQLLQQINHELNITIVMITHQMEVVQKICNRVAVMSEGKVVEEGSVKKIFTMPKHPVTKSFIRDIKNNNEFDLNVLKNIYLNGTLLKVIFDENTSRTPILTNVIRECDALINVIEANLTNTIDSSFGIMILEVIGDYKKVIELFNKYFVEVEVI